MTNTLISVIKTARPRRALFTTFTFSLSWFEALILPALRQSNCEQIDVLVDARQACKSTDEAASLYAGSAYRVIPVYMDKTKVFHPKLAYFEGWDEHDHLVVASANLTMSGHGRNLEVIDAISSNTEPAVFREFSEFLHMLTKRHTFAEECLDVLSKYARRAQGHLTQASTINEGARRTWLVHTLVTPASEQFLEHAARIDNANRLTVLSPFHSPSGAPVQDLVREIGVASLRIGLDARTLIAPFTDENVFDIRPGYVIPERDDDPKRRLHAKCFELEGSNGTLVMTGSVNATGQSLCTTDNVEVSLIRYLPDSPFSWIETEPVKYAPCDFNVEAMTARNPAIQATWTAANELRGRVEPASGSTYVTLSVWDGDVRMASVDEVHLETGQFSINMGHPINARGALRLRVDGHELHAEGWINVELDLAGDENQRNLAKASSRVMSDEFRPEDLSTIFEWLARLQTRATPRNLVDATSLTPTSPKPSATPAPATHRKLTYEEWRASVEEPLLTKVPASLTRNTVEAVLRWLNRDITPQTSTTTPLDRPPSKRPHQPIKRALLATEKSEFKAESNAGDADRDERAEAYYRALLEAIPNGLELEARSSVAPILVELSGCVQLKQAFGQEIQTSQKSEHIALSLQAWLNRFSRFDYGDENRRILLPFFAAMACCTAAAHAQASRPLLKQSLESIAGGTLECGAISEGARLALRTNRFDRVSEALKLAALNAAEAIEFEQTQSQRLVTLIGQIAISGAKCAPRTTPTYQKAFEALWQHRNNIRCSFGVVSRRKGAIACPCCYAKLQAEDASRLRVDQVSLCLNCNRPIFYALDTAALDQIGLTGRYKKN